MLLLFISSLILIACTFSTGFYTLQFFTKKIDAVFHNGIMECMLMGLMVQFAFFSICSLWLPMNFYLLIPFVVISLFFFINNKNFFFLRVREQVVFFKQPYLFVTLTAIIALLCFCITPPIHGDSAGYHYLSVKWYETYKVVPGLSNIHGRFAFNPAIFTISAPYAFTDVVGQSLYPVNGVLIGCFILWWLKKIYALKNSWCSVAHIISLVMVVRQLMVNIPSPASDALAIITSCYVVITLFEKLVSKKQLQPSTIVWLLILNVFGLVCKLSIAPLLATISMLLLPIIARLNFKQVSLIVLVSLCIIVPWLIRNYILSGYLIYPIVSTAVGNPIWKSPFEIPQLDYIFIHDGARLYDISDKEFYSSHSFFNWFIFFIKELLKSNSRFPDVVFLFASFASPVIWLIVGRNKIRAFFLVFKLWLCIYVCCLFWLIVSPDFRFGVVFHSMSLLLPIYIFCLNKNQASPVYHKTGNCIIMFMFVYYASVAFNHGNYYPFKLSNVWLKPLKDKRYQFKNNLASFSHKQINATTIYYADENHECINCPLPCVVLPYGEIGMIGAKIEDGFFLKKNEIKKNFPKFFNK